MAGRSKKTTRVSVSLDEGDYRRLLAMAERSDASVAWVIRRAIAELLEREGSGQQTRLPLEAGGRDG